MGDQKNLVLAILVSGLILLAWNFFYLAPQQEKRQARQQEIAAQQQAQGVQPQGQAGTGDPDLRPTLPQLPGDAAEVDDRSRETALEQSPRIAIESPRLRGSISLTGARLDDLVLTDYRETIEPDSPDIVLLNPTGSEKPYYVEFGWLARNVALPSASTVWRADRKVLSPGVPVNLVWDNGEGLIFERRLDLDENYMITVTQRVRNTGARSVELYPYGLVSRTGTPEVLGYYILHEGLLGVLNETLREVDYDDLAEDGPVTETSTGGWLGITDKYWLVALIPDQKSVIETTFQHSKGEREGKEKYQADYRGPAVVVPPGESATVNSRVFVGAKIVRLLDAYEEEAGVPNFDLAVDFGWFYFLTKPIFYMLDWFFDLLGNFGLAILALTVVIKGLFFPLANKSYRAMSRMKLLQPKMKELKEQFGDDRTKLNTAMMELYKREKVNPAAGCLPIVIQIPVFFSLYKVLFVTIEMRQTPFYGWISDLSAPDPLGVLTLFGLVDWNVPAMLVFLNIGVWPILMGITMFLQQKLNPPPPDPMQAKLFMMLPLFFTFILGSFPAGLVIYWTWNNLLTICQQYVIMRGVKRAAAAPARAVAFEAAEPEDIEPESAPETEAGETTDSVPQILAPKKPKRKRKRRK